MHPSDSSYDADQSRVDDAGQARKVHHNDVNNSSLRDVTDDVVVQVCNTVFNIPSTYIDQDFIKLLYAVKLVG